MFFHVTVSCCISLSLFLTTNTFLCHFSLSLSLPSFSPLFRNGIYISSIVFLFCLLILHSILLVLFYSFSLFLLFFLFILLTGVGLFSQSPVYVPVFKATQKVRRSSSNRNVWSYLKISLFVVGWKCEQWKMKIKRRNQGKTI